MCAVAAEQVYGDQEMHGVVRQQCCDMLVCGLGALQGPCDGECAVKGLTLRALAGHTVASSPVVMCRWWRAGAVRVNETVSECGHQGESDVQKPNCGVERRWCIEAEAKKNGVLCERRSAPVWHSHKSTRCWHGRGEPHLSLHRSRTPTAGTSCRSAALLPASVSDFGLELLQPSPPCVVPAEKMENCMSCASAKQMIKTMNSVAVTRKPCGFLWPTL